jgi:hypothetical protein
MRVDVRLRGNLGDQQRQRQEQVNSEFAVGAGQNAGFLVGESSIGRIEVSDKGGIRPP